MTQWQLRLAQISFVVLWSSGFVGAKYGLEFVGVFTFLYLRYTLLAIILMCLVFSMHRAKSIEWSSIRQFCLIGTLAHALYLSTMWVAFVLGATAGTAALIGVLQPVVTAVIASVTLGEHNTSRQWLGIAIGFIAIALIVLNGMAVGGNAISYGLLFISLGCITTASLHQRWIDGHSNREPVPLTINLALQCSVSALVLSVPAYLLEGASVVWKIEFICVLLWLAIAVSLGGFGAFWYLVKRCPVSQISCLVYLSVPMTMLLSYFVFGEK